MSKQKPVSLQQLKSQMETEAQQRQSVIERGERAYKLGIEKNNCPIGEPSGRQLWTEGWDKARKAHEAMFNNKSRG